MLLEGQIQPGGHVTVTVDNDRLSFRVDTPEAAQPVSVGGDTSWRGH